MSSNLFFQGMMYLVTLVYGGYLIANQEMSASDLAMYALYIGIFISPIQILVEDETSDAMAFLNEKFVFSRIAKYLMGDGKRVILSPETKKGFLNYLDSLFYYLKYRNYDAEMLEMMLMGFKAGVLVADDLKEQES